MGANRGDYEFFISHAAADQGFARVLFHLLDPCWRCFLAEKSIPAAGRWRDVLGPAQTSARSSLLLLSRNSVGANYQLEEIDRAIRLHKISPHLPVPVLIERPTDRSLLPKLYLGQFQALDFGEGGPLGLARAIAKWARAVGLEAPTVRSPVVARPTTTRPSTTSYVRFLDGFVELLGELFFPKQLLWLVRRELGPVVEGLDQDWPLQHAAGLLTGSGRITPTFFARLREQSATHAEQVDDVQRLWTGFLGGREVEASSEPDPAGTSMATVAAPPVVEGRPIDGPAPRRESRAGVAIQELRAAPMLSDYRSLAALRLDRSAQWSRFRDEVDDGGNRLFLLRGHHRNALGQFVDRIRHFFRPGGGHSALVRYVPLELDQSPAATGSDWVIRVASALSGGVRKAAVPALREASRTGSVVLALGRRPLSALSATEERGLRGFITDRLPRLIEDAAPVHPVHVIVPVEFRDGDPDTAGHRDDVGLAARIDEWGRAAQKSGLLRYVRLKEVRMPDWDEVEEFLDNVGAARPSEDVLADIKQTYELLIDSPFGDYMALTRLLDRKVGER